MQIPLVALSTAAMRPTVTSVASTLLGSAALGSAGTIGLCGALTYADGGLYCRENEQRMCLGDLGDFPTKKSFPLTINWADDLSLYLMKPLGSRKYMQYRDKLYIDTSPGAFEPLRFTADNTTLAEGETSWAWTGAMGLIMWTPSGNLVDATPGKGGSIVGQGFQMVEVEGYKGLYRAYWNQTLFEEVIAGRSYGDFLTLCQGDYDGRIVRGDRP